MDLVEFKFTRYISNLLEPTSCSDEFFTFSNYEVMQEVLERALKIETIFGHSPSVEKFKNKNFHMVFLAHPYGLAISAEELSLHTKFGEIKLDQLKELNTKWWKYWRRYCDLKGTSEELPYDYACEALFPAE